MTDWDAFTTGWHHATWAAGYLVGALLPLLFVAALFAAGWFAYGWVDHRLRVHRLRRDVRRTGRARTTPDPLVTAPQTTGKAIAANPDVFLAWSFLIRDGKLPDRGLTFSPELTEQTGDDRHVYTFPAGLEGDVIRDFEHVAATYTDQPQTPLWTPN